MFAGGVVFCNTHITPPPFPIIVAPLVPRPFHSTLSLPSSTRPHRARAGGDLVSLLIEVATQTREMRLLPVVAGNLILTAADRNGYLTQVPVPLRGP